MSTDSKTIKLTNVRLSYPHLFSPQESRDPNGKAKFTASFILDKKKDAAQITLLQNAIKAILDETKVKVDKDKLFLKDGANKEDSYGPEVMFINTSSTRRPQVVNRDRSPITEEDDVVYGGCYVNCWVTPWVQNNDFGKRVNCSLEIVQFVKDGERFGRSPLDVNEVVPDLSETEDVL